MTSTVREIRTEWHKIQFPKAIIQSSEYSMWLAVNAVGGYYIGWDVLYFQKESDATMFRLKWL